LSTQAPPAGWYQDPGGAGLRYWDGARWTEQVQSAVAGVPVTAAAGADPAPTVAAPQTGGPAAGWHRDPSGRHPLRYWDGFAWTEHVGDGAGWRGVDPPIGPMPAVAAQPGPVTPGRCSRCGTPYAAADSYCGICGWPVGPGAQPAPQAPPTAYDPNVMYGGPPQPPSIGRSRTSSGSSLSVISLIGSIAVAVASILPWLQTPGGGATGNAFDVSLVFLFNPDRAGTGGLSLGIALLALGVAGAVLTAIRAPTYVRRIVGSVTTAGVVLFLAQVVRIATENGNDLNPFTIIGFGAYVALVGGILISSGR
jgi:hypothetical protein